jgi:predicted nucleic acid-binding protein
MKYVLDVSVGLKWLLKEADSDKADELRDQFRNHAHDLLAPDTFLTEAAHALTRAERKKIIAYGEAEILFSDLLTTLPHLHSAASLLPRAIRLSSQLRIGAFDCLYFALAEREKCAVVTADSRLVNAAKGHHVVVLANLP